jgi:hypothetical protein
MQQRHPPPLSFSRAALHRLGSTQINRVVYVCQGHDHPAMLTRTALLRTPHWLSPAHAETLVAEGHLRCQYKARYGQQPAECTLYPAAAPTVDAGQWPGSLACNGETGSRASSGLLGRPFQPSTYTRLHPSDEGACTGYLVAHFGRPEWGVTPQQAFVAYDDEVCLGSALIAAPGRSLLEGEGGDLAASPARNVMTALAG